MCQFLTGKNTSSLTDNSRNTAGDRYQPPRRDNSDISPDGLRRNRGFPIPGGDRYRPPQDPFHAQHNPRSEYDSYRPPHEDPWTPLAPRESVSAPVHRRVPSGPHHTRGHFDFRAAGGRQPQSASMSPKMFHRFPEKRNRGFSFNQDRTMYSDDQPSYEGHFSRAGYSDHEDGNSRRSKSIPSRPSSRSSIASSVPSERNDVSSSSTAPIVSEQATEEENPLTAETPPEHPKSPVHRPSSPRVTRSPDGFRHSLTSSESRMKDTCPPPLQPEVKDNDITEEVEVQQILSPKSKLIDRLRLRSFFVIISVRSIGDEASS